MKNQGTIVSRTTAANKMYIQYLTVEFVMFFLNHPSTAFQCSIRCNTNKTNTTIADQRCISDQTWRLMPINGVRLAKRTLRICNTKPEKLIAANESNIRQSIIMLVLILLITLMLMLTTLMRCTTYARVKDKSLKKRLCYSLHSATTSANYTDIMTL